MIEIKFNEKKLNSLYKKMDNIEKNINKHIEVGLEAGLKEIQKMAYQYKKGKKEGILIEVTNKSGQIVGRVYTDKDIMPWALFLEFGTGTYAELPHIGKTKTFFASGFQYWYLPIGKATREFGEDRKITLNGRTYYVMYAQQPKPFMRPAGFNGRDKVVDEVKKAINEFLKEAVK